MTLQLEIVRTVTALRSSVSRWRGNGESVGVVPTMGMLHSGHLRLVGESRSRCRRTIVTIFVNAKQFDDAADFATYPRDEESDRAKLAAASVDVLYAPDPTEMYPPGFATTVSVGGIREPLCGAFRPGYCDGVATVVTKLLLQALADVAFFGEKDFQQLQIVRRLVRDLNIPTEIICVPTLREEDGLALSSRNVRLTGEERKIAPRLYRVLQAVSARFARGDDPDCPGAVRELLGAGFSKVDYVEVQDEDTLELADKSCPHARVFGAAHLGRTRLTDNVLVAPGPAPSMRLVDTPAAHGQHTATRWQHR